MNINYNVLIFVHIQKTAGSTLRWITRRQYPKGAVLEIGKSPHHFPLEEFKRLELAERDRIDCVVGHIPYGLHEYLSRPADYITFLRDPIERGVPQFYYICRRPSNRIYPLIKAKNFSLVDYVENDEYGRPDNMQIRYIIGAGTEAQMTANELEQAKVALLDRFVCFGLAERFDDSLVLLRKALGWGRVYYLEQNVTKDRPALTDIPQGIIKRFEEKYALDAELYEFGRREFEKRVTSMSDTLGKELATLKMLNAMYGVFNRAKTILQPTNQRNIGETTGLLGNSR